MARTRKSKVKVHRIVAPGMIGAEDFVERIQQHGMFEIGRASTVDQKDFIDDMIATQAALMGSTNVARDLDALMATYQTSLWIYSCVYQIASNLSMVPMVAEYFDKKTSKWVAQPDSDVQQIIDNPGSLLSMPDTIERISTYMELCGTEVVVAERQNGDPESLNGPIVGFQPLRPSWVWIDAAPPFIGRYRYFVNGQYISIDPGNAEMIRYVNPLNDYWGQSPISTLKRTISIDSKVENFNESTLDFGGVPEVVLETDKDLARGNARRHKLLFEQTYLGPKGRGGVVVLDGGMKLKPIGLPPKDMQFEEMGKISRHRILSAYGVPPVMVMDFSDASVLANANDQRKLFYQQTLSNKGRRIENALSKIIARTYPFFRVRFAFEQVDVLKDHEKLRAAATADYGAGIITLNEARAVQGLEPMADGDTVKPPAPVIAPPDKPGMPNGKMPMKRLHAAPEYKALARAQYKRSTALWLPKMRGSFRTFFKGQRDRVLTAMRGIKIPERGLVAAAAGAATQKAIDPITGQHFDDTILDKIFSTHDEAERMLKEIGPVFLLGLMDSANSKIDQLDPSSKLALQESHWGIRTFYAGWGATRVVDINETTRDAIKDAIEYGFEHGYSEREMEDAITAKFQDLTRGGDGDPELQSDFPEYRLERIARTETATMLNAGSVEGTKALIADGATVVKSWLSARDNLVRDSHAQMDDETSDDPIPFGEAFSNGLQFPNDPSGPAEEVINCRCTLIEQVVGEEAT